MIAIIEPLAGVIRYWSTNNPEYGDPYQWSATVRWVNRDTIEVMGVTQVPTTEVWRAVKDCARNIGVKYITFTRFKNGVRKTSTLKLTKDE